MLGLRLSWEDEREKHNSWKRPRACGTLRFHELCFSLSSSHESRKPNIHFLNNAHRHSLLLYNNYGAFGFVTEWIFLFKFIIDIKLYFNVKKLLFKFNKIEKLFQTFLNIHLLNINGMSQYFTHCLHRYDIYVSLWYIWVLKFFCVPVHKNLNKIVQFIF